jgi:hypothetical protein
MTATRVELTIGKSLRNLMGSIPGNPPDPTAHLKATLWKAERVRMCMRKICSELGESIAPLAYRRQLDQVMDLESGLSGLFCFSAWIAPVVSNHSDVGAYSNSTAAMVYKHVATRMPRLILVAAFGKSECGENMKMFMDNAIDAEERITEMDLEMVADITPKDRGPFLYWLLNERALSFLATT